MKGRGNGRGGLQEATVVHPLAWLGALLRGGTFRRMPPMVRSVVVALLGHVDAGSLAWPSVALMAELTGLTPRSVWKAVAWLRGGGLIRREGYVRREGVRGHGPARWRLILPAVEASVQSRKTLSARDTVFSKTLSARDQNPVSHGQGELPKELRGENADTRTGGSGSRPPEPPAASGSQSVAGPVSPRPMKGPWMEENMTLVELAELFVAVPPSGFAHLYSDLLRHYKQDLLDEAVKLVIPGWPLEQTEGAWPAGGRVALSGSAPSGGSSETVGGPSVEDLVAGLLDVADAEERRTVAELLVKWGLSPATVAEALWLAQEITTVDPEEDRQAARWLAQHGDAPAQEVITYGLSKAKAWLADAAQMRAQDPKLWDTLRREEAVSRNGRVGRA